MGYKRSRVQCFFLQPTERVEVSLRRFSYVDKTSPPTPDKDATACPGKYGYHTASVVIAHNLHKDAAPKPGDQEDRTDPAWPLSCPWCGGRYRFREVDEWQVNVDPLYHRTDGDPGLVTLQRAPVGAMWDAVWYKDRPSLGRGPGPDGRYLVVRTPGGDWEVDAPSTNGPGWQRTGDPEVYPTKITAQPSIHFPGRYHGFLRNGWLEEV